MDAMLIGVLILFLAIVMLLWQLMHQQQEILERQSARLTQVEIQNAELVTILTQSMKRKD